jgi:ABC-2 type transport system permease protein
MIFLCGLFFPVAKLPLLLRPLSYALPVTYWADLLHAGLQQQGRMPFWLDFPVLSAFCLGLFLLSLRNIRKKWIA